MGAGVVAVVNRAGGVGKTATAKGLISQFLEFKNAAGRDFLFDNVGALDLDFGQQTLWRWTEARRRTAEREFARLPVIPDPNGAAFELGRYDRRSVDHALETLQERSNIIIIDTPGREQAASDHAVWRADIVVSPVLSSAEKGPDTLEIDGEPSSTARMIMTIRERRECRGERMHWAVLKTAWSKEPSRREERRARALEDMARRYDFALMDGVWWTEGASAFDEAGLTFIDGVDPETGEEFVDEATRFDTVCRQLVTDASERLRAA